MIYHERPLIDRDVPEAAGGVVERGLAESEVGGGAACTDVDASSSEGERAARATLRAQIARLERERAAIVAERFPYIAAPAPIAGAHLDGPTLLNLEQLERLRDQLAAGLQELHAAVRERTERERRAREQLQRMRLEPGRYKFARLSVRELGQGVCGVWEVRPRLGLIGMLAGWWQLKLSSGCPLVLWLGSSSTYWWVRLLGWWVDRACR
ncbi:MAG TPA: hypothetical protein VED41_06275 [Solirubrobacteraceae bacterium]|nr:hypothetical protein [Solirubrobacteraceae bacterium]